MFSVFCLLLAFYLIFSIYVGLKNDANLHTILQGTSYIFVLIAYILLVSYIITLSQNSDIAYISAFFFVIPFIILILVYKSEIAGTIRVIDYYIHRKKVFEQGYEDISLIVDIKKISFGKYGRNKKYYLIVDYNGEKIKSLYFWDDIYSTGENIKIMIYENYKYVILNENTN